MMKEPTWKEERLKNEQRKKEENCRRVQQHVMDVQDEEATRLVRAGIAAQLNYVMDKRGPRLAQCVAELRTEFQDAPSILRIVERLARERGVLKQAKAFQTKPFKAKGRSAR